jgi:cytochrome c oxidase cbb3-type subunit III
LKTINFLKIKILEWVAMNTHKIFSIKRLKTVLTGAALLLAAGTVSAADAPPVKIDGDFMRDIKILMYILIFIALLIGYIAVVLSVKDVSKLSLRSIWDNVVGRDATDPETDHDYDGIRELDNPMPAWLRFIFIGTIVFAFVYMIHYHFLKTGPLSREEYENEMALAAETYKSVELPDDQLNQITDAGRLVNAQAIFTENCATCHRVDLGGESGPNLTDEFWLHGGTVKDIYHTITNGVPGKTMISWKDRITSQQRLEIASFILSKQGSKPANPRAPEGSKAGEAPVTAPTDSAGVAADTTAKDTSVTQ